ncbi:hypothetical protein CCAX7_57710 [Capsulimonas corticalis]|uniref:Uncharacterized protein n=1 Tax=Capsulimonas corticalis TaxID=2219043 RepID=A0A402D0B0_9BACT|nr:hypothetical protein [Capsulimonas corticalis]BDI33720.1 hypothetical protein CCAX7_57710 [Capsulimonas corticalis]
MGTWDTGLIADVTIQEIYLDCLARYDEGFRHEEIRSALNLRFADLLEDPCDACVVWFALANAQWEYGVLEPDVLARVEDLIKSKKALTHWEETDENDQHRRKGALAKFLGRIQQPKTRPRRQKKARTAPAGTMTTSTL